MARKKRCPGCGSKKVKKRVGNGGAVPVEQLGQARPRDPVPGRKRQDSVNDMSFRGNDLTLIAYKDVVIG
jgi:hypothetical protein